MAEGNDQKGKQVLPDHIKYVDSDEEYMSDIECDLCAKSFSNVSNYEQHLKSKKHHQMLQKKKAKDSMGTTGPEKTSDKSDDEDAEQLYCKLCDKYISGYIPYKAHLNGNTHHKNMQKEKMKELLKDQPGVLENDDSHGDENFQKPFAKCCDKVFHDPRAYQLHLKGSSHQKELKKRKILEELKNGDKDVAGGEDVFSRCEICDKFFTSPISYKNHLTSPVHLKKVERDKAEEALKELFQKDESGKLVCKECNKPFTDPFAFKLHLDNNSHAKQKTRDQLFDFVAANPEIAAVKSIHSLAGDTEEEADEMEGYKNGHYFLVCKLCHVSFSGPQSARDHVESRKHIKEKKNVAEMKKLKDALRASESNPKNKPAADDFELV